MKAILKALLLLLTPFAALGEEVSIECVVPSSSSGIEMIGMPSTFKAFPAGFVSIVESDTETVKVKFNNVFDEEVTAISVRYDVDSDTTFCDSTVGFDNNFDIEATCYGKDSSYASIGIVVYFGDAESEECETCQPPDTTSSDTVFFMYEVPCGPVCDTLAPTSAPTSNPTANPTTSPTPNPTAAPTSSPTATPTASPTGTPTLSPSSVPTTTPSAEPSSAPTDTPTISPTIAPTRTPSASPTAYPTTVPTLSQAPTECTMTTAAEEGEMIGMADTFSVFPEGLVRIVESDSEKVTVKVNNVFDDAVTAVSVRYDLDLGTVECTTFTSFDASFQIEAMCSGIEAQYASIGIVVYFGDAESEECETCQPPDTTSSDTVFFSFDIPCGPVCDTLAPTSGPTSGPTPSPTSVPTAAPTSSPTSTPTASPTGTPTLSPSSVPTTTPSAEPSSAPTDTPTISPTIAPTRTPSASPTAYPTTVPTLSQAPTECTMTTAAEEGEMIGMADTFSVFPEGLVRIVESDSEKVTFKVNNVFDDAVTAVSVRYDLDLGTVECTTFTSFDASFQIEAMCSGIEAQYASIGIVVYFGDAESEECETCQPPDTTSSDTVFFSFDIPCGPVCDTLAPTSGPTSGPTPSPTSVPTAAPTSSPTSTPTASPTGTPTLSPSSVPTTTPSAEPSSAPTDTPTISPTIAPTRTPSGSPTAYPTTVPTLSQAPTECTMTTAAEEGEMIGMADTFSVFPEGLVRIVESDSEKVTVKVNNVFDDAVTAVSVRYDLDLGTVECTTFTSFDASFQIEAMCSGIDAQYASIGIVVYFGDAESEECETCQPPDTTSSDTVFFSFDIPCGPVCDTLAPTSGPTSGPTPSPTSVPTAAPTSSPTSTPTASPTGTPTLSPSSVPTTTPSAEPSSAPTDTPTISPTIGSTGTPSTSPTANPTTVPTLSQAPTECTMTTAAEEIEMIGMADTFTVFPEGLIRIVESDTEIVKVKINNVFDEPVTAVSVRYDATLDTNECSSLTSFDSSFEIEAVCYGIQSKYAMVGVFVYFGDAESEECETCQPPDSASADSVYFNFMVPCGPVCDTLSPTALPTVSPTIAPSDVPTESPTLTHSSVPTVSLSPTDCIASTTADELEMIGMDASFSSFPEGLVQILKSDGETVSVRVNNVFEKRVTGVSVRYDLDLDTNECSTMTSFDASFDIEAVCYGIDASYASFSIVVYFGDAVSEECETCQPPDSSSSDTVFFNYDVPCIPVCV